MVACALLVSVAKAMRWSFRSYTLVYCKESQTCQQVAISASSSYLLDSEFAATTEADGLHLAFQSRQSLHAEVLFLRRQLALYVARREAEADRCSNAGELAPFSRRLRLGAEQSGARCGLHHECSLCPG